MRLIDADEIERILNNAIQIQEGMSKEMGIEKDEFVQGELKGYRDILNGIKEQPTVKTRKELAKDAVVTDDPQTNIEVMMNLSYGGEDGQVWIRGGGEDGEDCTLVEMCRRMCKKCDQYEENPMEYADPEDFGAIGDLFMDCSMDSCPVGHTYFIAIQAAELRNRLRQYEEGTSDE